MSEETISPPFRRMRDGRQWSVEDQAKALGLTINQVHMLDAGQTLNVLDAWRPGIEAAGFDFDELRRTYARWRDSLSGSPQLPAELTNRKLSSLDAKILEAIEQGIRGVGNIAKAAGVGQGQVTHFLKHGRAPY